MIESLMRHLYGMAVDRGKETGDQFVPTKIEAPKGVR